ncbi:MFS transporter [Jidongwangia harbinensis]|uniref:MFS transporter n=1 Tax=Jidongwangia harbinensis TaxID=2878561 RepID=UPI001CD955A7|nr:MFS transporter [Jidongwangia harbinensis]MCA2211386.1 MFS transporter [Jidongwangia harbinensis]
MTSIAPASRRPNLILALVCQALFVDSLLYSVAVPVLPGYSQRLGASDWAIGLLFGAYAIGLLVASPVAGAVVDRVGFRVPMVVGSFGIAAATLVFALGDRYELLLSARMMQGVGAAVVWTAGVALIADVVPARRLGSAMGAAMAVTSIGLIVGPPLGGLMVEGFGRSAPFLTTAAAALVNAVLQLVVLPTGTTTRRRAPGLPSLLTYRPALMVAAAVALGSAALTFLEPTLPLDLTVRLGTGVAGIGMAFGVATLLHSASAVGVGWLSGRIRYPVLAGAGLILAGAALPTLVLASSLYTVTLGLCVVAVGLTFVVVPALPELAGYSDRTGAGRGATYALFNAAYAVGMLVGPVAGGVGLSLGRATTVYAAAGITVAIGGFLVLVEAAVPSNARLLRVGSARSGLSQNEE